MNKNETGRQAARPRRPGAKWLIAPNLLIIAGLVAATAMGLHASREADEARTREAVENVARGLAAETSAQLRQIDNALATVARHVGRVGLSPAHRIDNERGIADQQVFVPQVEAIRVTDAADLVVAGGQGHSLNVVDRDYFAKAQASQAMVVSEPLQSRGTGQWGLVLARAIRLPDGTFAGLVYASVSSQHFRDGFQRLAMGP